MNATQTHHAPRLKLGLVKGGDPVGYQRERRKIIRAMGLCFFCLGPNDRPGVLSCSECRAVAKMKAAA